MQKFTDWLQRDWANLIIGENNFYNIKCKPPNSGHKEVFLKVHLSAYLNLKLQSKTCSHTTGK